MPVMISRLRSWMFWERYSEKLKNKFDIHFPGNYQNFHRLYGRYCPICQDTKNFVVQETGERIYCVCEMLEWSGNQIERMAEYESPVTRERYLRDLKPLRSKQHASEFEQGVQDLEAFLKHMQKWMSNPTSWIFIQGGFGCGKTHALHAIKTRFNPLTLFVSMDRFQQNLFNALEEGEIEYLMQTFSSAPILILDDWGTEHQKPWTIKMMSSVINNRYSLSPRDFPTIVSTNLSISDLMNSPDVNIGRIATRLVDTDISNIFRLRQPDFRSPIVQKKLQS